MPEIPTKHPAKRDLTVGPLAKTLFRLAAPIAVGTLLHALYSMVDAYWLGKVSKEALAAPGVSMPLLFIGIAFGIGFSNAGTALVAQYTGAGRHREASRAAGQTILVLSILITVLAVPTILLAPQLFRLFQVPSEARPQAVAYLRIVMAGMPLMAFGISYGAVLRALGDTITVVVIAALANAVNMVLDPCLIYGWGALPALGATGAALATLISRIAGGLACLVCLRRGRAGLHITLADLKPDWPMIRRTFAVGLPAAIGNSTTSIGFAAHMVMVNVLGTTVIGAVTIGFRVIHFFRVPAQAMAMAAAPVVGQALGAGRPKLARRAVWASAAWVAVVMLGPFAFLTLWGRLVARCFLKDPEVIAETSRFFLVVPVSSYFFGVLLVLMAAFYGSGHTRPAMVLSIIRWLLRLPLSYVLGFVVGMGSLGIYAGMAIANVLCALITLWIFLTGAWQTAVVPAPGGPSEQPPAGEADRP